MEIIKSSGRFLYLTAEGAFLSPTAHRKTFEEPTSFSLPQANSDLLARTLGTMGLVASLVAYASGAIDQEQYKAAFYSLLTTNIVYGIYEFIIRPIILKRNRNNSNGLEDQL